MLSASIHLRRLIMFRARARVGELGKLAIFFAFYAIYAWRAFHKEVCEGGQSGTYPCPPSPLRLRLWHQLCHPGDILSTVFFQPKDTADRQDGLSCATFLLGGLLAISLGPATADARRTCNLRLAWLLCCVLLPKGFLIGYGIARPAASLGAAINIMLPRHTAIMIWISLAFPVSFNMNLRKTDILLESIRPVLRCGATIRKGLSP